jgi:transposase
MDLKEQRIVEAYKGGDTGTAIAQREGISASTVYNILEQYGIPRDHRRGPTSPSIYAERNRQIAAAYQAGETMQQIADREGISRERVRKILAGMGIAGRKPWDSGGHRRKRQQRAERQARVVEAYKQGASIGQLAASEGVQVQIIRRYLKEAGIHLPPRGNPYHDPEREKRVVEAYVKGDDTVAAIADREGIHFQSVYRYLYKHNVPRHRQAGRKG